MALPLAAAAAEVNEVRRVPIAPGLLDANYRHVRRPDGPLVTAVFRPIWRGCDAEAVCATEASSPTDHHPARLRYKAVPPGRTW